MKYIISETNAIDSKTGVPILTATVKGFPYPERNCPFCEQELSVENAIHHPEHGEIYKCVYQCLNDQCGSYDEEAQSSYVRVYYSSDLALELFETLFLKIQREIKN